MAAENIKILQNFASGEMVRISIEPRGKEIKNCRDAVRYSNSLHVHCTVSLTAILILEIYQR